MTEDVDIWTDAPARGQVLPSLSARAYNKTSQHPHRGERSSSEEPWTRSTTAALLHWWDNTINHSVEMLVWWTQASVRRSRAFMEVAFISTHPSKAVHSCHRRSLTLRMGNPFWSCQIVWEKGAGEKQFVCRVRVWRTSISPEVLKVSAYPGGLRSTLEMQRLIPTAVKCPWPLTGSWIRRPI